MFTERIVEPLVRQVGASVAATNHPRFGRRLDRQSLRGWEIYDRYRPEWLIGSADVSEAVSAAAHALTERLGPAPDMNGAWVIDVPGVERFATLSLGGWHPDLGPALVLTLSTPWPGDPLEAVDLVHRLNSAAAHSGEVAGAWWADDGWVGHTAAVPRMALNFLLRHAADYGPVAEHVADLIGPSAMDPLAELLSAVSGRTDFWPTAGTPEAEVDHRRPPAVLPELFEADRARRITDVADGCPHRAPRISVAEAASPQLIDLDPDVLLVVEGRAAPGEPVVRTIGLCDVPDGRRLLVRWLREPERPSAEVLAVLPNPTPEAFAAALPEALPDLVTGDLPDFVRLIGPAELADPVRRAYLVALERRVQEREDLGSVAAHLIANPGTVVPRDEYGRLAIDELPTPMVELTPIEAAAQWWQAVTGAPHVAAQSDQLPGLWDEAEEVLRRIGQPEIPDLTDDPLRAVLPQVLRRLRIEPEWVIREDDSAGMVCGALGTWLTLDQGEQMLHVEVRLARRVSDHAAALRFCEDRNQYALLGRWAFDPGHEAIALCADLLFGGQFTVDMLAEIVAEMVNTAETVAFNSGPQRIGAITALTSVDGRRRDSAHELLEHLPRNVYPEGENIFAPYVVMSVVRDELPRALPAWTFEHTEGDAYAEHESGARLLIRESQHPSAGWGLMVSLVPWPDQAVPRTAAALGTLNAAESAAGLDRLAVGCWIAGERSIEYRAFFPAALLNASQGSYGAASLVVTFMREAAARVDELVADGTPVHAQGFLRRPHWPDDETNEGRARRTPINDRLPNELDVAHIWIDGLGRGCATGLASWDRWVAQLAPEDLDDDGVRGLMRWWADEEKHRARRNAGPSGQEHDG